MNNKIRKTLLTFVMVAVLFSALKAESAPLPKIGTYEIEDVTFILRSPNGYDLTVRSVRPKISLYPSIKFPAVFRLAGGWGGMYDIINGEPTKKAASRGIIFLTFDSPMRIDYPVGSPKGDYKGFKDQDDVAIVLEKGIIENQHVDKSAIGFWTHSSGALLASSVLGRIKYEKISEKVSFFIDEEGPHCPEELLKDPSLNGNSWGLKMWRMARDAKVGPGKDYHTEEEFWRQRCGYSFIGNYKGIYQRVQGKNDHALGYYYKHAIAYLNGATNGKAKWSRLNKQPKNQIYKSEEYPNGINIESVLDFEKLNDVQLRLWNLLFEIIEESRGDRYSAIHIGYK